ncbi:RNA polymerase sigma factor RpoD [uncultured archaeon]|nr:RNA polymerase sigma factor RpoD [uncultured archaeon]
MTDAGVYKRNRKSALPRRNFQVFELLTPAQEIEYAKQLRHYKNQIISLLTNLPPYEGCLEQRMREAYLSPNSEKRTALLIRNENDDEKARERMGACLETVQKINKYLSRRRSQHRTQVKIENRRALYCEFSYTHRTITHLVSDFEKAEPGDRHIIEQINRLYSEYKKIFDHYCDSNLRLVTSIAKNYAKKGLHIDDLLSEGALGLMTAVDRFDPERGCKFSTFATHWIRQGIRKALYNTTRLIRIPINKMDEIETFKKARKDLILSGITPTLERISQITGIDVDDLKVIAAIRTRTPLSLDGQIKNVEDEERGSFAEILEDKKSTRPEDAAEAGELQDELIKTLLKIPEKYGGIIILRYGLGGIPMKLDDAGKAFGVTRERARQIQNKAESILKSRGILLYLEDFLD